MIEADLEPSGSVSSYLSIQIAPNEHEDSNTFSRDVSTRSSRGKP